jgi:hypothetical protein
MSDQAKRETSSKVTKSKQRREREREREEEEETKRVISGRTDLICLIETATDYWSKSANPFSSVKGLIDVNALNTIANIHTRIRIVTCTK